MAYPEQYGNDRAGRLAAEIAAIRRMAHDAGRGAAFIVPILDADPAPGDPTNMWAFDDGRIRFRGTDGTVHELVPPVDQGYRIKSLSANPAASTGIDFYRHAGSDEFRIRRPDGTWARYAAISPTSGGEGGGSSTGSGTTTQPKQPQASPHTHRKTYAPQWGRTICPVHGVELGSELRYGRWNSTHGQRRIMLGDFREVGTNTTPNDDLAPGDSIRKVELHMRNTDAFSFSGITVRWGGHDRIPPTISYSAVRRNVFEAHWPHTGDGAFWRGGSGDITWFGRAFRDDVIRGLVIDQLSDSRSFYGAMDWKSVRLRITYTHTH